MDAAAAALAPPLTLLSLILDPPLPPLLAPIPFIFRVLAYMLAFPFVFLTALDGAAYVTFRTLGIYPRRVRVHADGEGAVKKEELERIKEDDEKSESEDSQKLTNDSSPPGTPIALPTRPASGSPTSGIRRSTKTSSLLLTPVDSSAPGAGAGTPDSSVERPRVRARAASVGVEGALGLERSRAGTPDSEESDDAHERRSSGADEEDDAQPGPDIDPGEVQADGEEGIRRRR